MSIDDRLKGLIGELYRCEHHPAQICNCEFKLKKAVTEIKKVIAEEMVEVLSLVVATEVSFIDAVKLLNSKLGMKDATN